jgi:hypothetical protein
MRGVADVLRLGRWLQIPQEVLDAQRDGRLVIFAGAGVSKEPPSGLPLFGELVAQIAKRALTDAEKERPDRLLGTLADKNNIDVHAAAKTILGRDSSQPASGHRSLIDLFPDPGALRIVTTNADRHFSTVLHQKDLARQVDTYYAPALPLGNDFAGLVYLHGSVDKDVQRMVLRDKDFGRAYLTDAYATRFLERLFAEFTVLFVGYSHHDFMMEFLGRGLYRSQGRYVLASDDGNDALSFWKSLDIEPCFYDVRSGTTAHSELWEGLAYWAACVQEPPSEIERRIREITAIPPSFSSSSDFVSPSNFVSPKDLSYLEWRLRDILGARFFARHAMNPAWLLWLESQSNFQMLFTTEGEAGPVGWTLAEWFCSRFVVGDGGEIGLAVVERHRPELHPALWHRVMRTLASAEKREPHEIAGKWIGVLLSSWHPSFNCDLLGRLLYKCQLPEELDSIVVLFDFLTRPLVKLERGFDLEPNKSASAAEPRSVLRSVGDPHQLIEFVEKKLRGNEQALFEDVLGIAEHHLAGGHRLLSCAGEASADFDETSFRRAAIEPNEQNSSPKTTDVLIDAARILLEWAGHGKPHLLDGYAERWIESPAPLLRRLAVYAVARRTDRFADDRLRWLVDHDLLFSLPAKHEVFGLLELAFGSASSVLQQSILDAAMTATSKPATHPERIPSDYERYNLLVWLDRCAPGLQSVSDRLAEVSKLRPEFAPRTHPDLGYEIKVGFEPTPEKDDVGDVLAMQPSELFAWVESCRDAPPDEDSCYARARVVQAAVAKSLSWGLPLAFALAERGDTDPSLWVHVIDGFKLASKTPEDWKQVLALFAGTKLVRRNHSLHIAWFLREGLTSGEEAIPRVLYPQLLDLVMNVWHEHPFLAPDGWMDWATAAINTTGGVVAEIVVAQISQLRQHSDNWEGFPAPYREAFESFLYSREDAAPYARVILSRGLHVLYDCDPEWTLKHIIPLLDWQRNAEHALQSWHGFLFTSRLPEECLYTLLPQYVESAARLKSEPDDLLQIQDQLAGHIGSILLFTDVDPYAENWMGRILSESPSGLRLALAERVQWFLGHIDDIQQREVRWETRLKPYWKNRLDGSLPGLEDDEKAAMTEWILPLVSCLPSVAELIQASGPTTSLDQAFWWHLAKEAAWIRKYPTETARLCTHLARGLPDAVEPYRIYGLDRVIAILEDTAVDKAAMQALREEALRLGISPKNHL